MTVGREEFERRVVKAFLRKGFGYEVILGIPVETFEGIYRAYADEDISFQTAIRNLKEAFENTRSNQNFS